MAAQLGEQSGKAAIGSSRWARQLVCSRTGVDGAARRAGLPLAGRRPLAGGVRSRCGERRAAAPRSPRPALDPLALPRAAASPDFDGRVDLGEGGDAARPAAPLGSGRDRAAGQGRGAQSHRLVQGPGPLPGREPGPRAGGARGAARERRQCRPGPHRLRRGGRSAGPGGPPRGHAADDLRALPRPTAPRCSPAPGTLVDAAKLLEEGKGYWNLSTLREPYRVEGKKTMGLSWPSSSAGSCRTGSSTPWAEAPASWGCTRLSTSCERLGLIGPKRPRFVVVQAAGCAPIVRAFEEGKRRRRPWEDPQTRVWGLRVPKAIGDFLVLRALRESGGRAVAVDEDAAPEVAAGRPAGGAAGGTRGRRGAGRRGGSGGGRGVLRRGSGWWCFRRAIRRTTCEASPGRRFLRPRYRVRLRRRRLSVGHGRTEILWEDAGRRGRGLGGSGGRSRDPLRLASLTKPFTATLALVLDAEGVLPLSTRIGEVWPEAHPDLAPRPLSDLLRHRSGWPPGLRSITSAGPARRSSCSCCGAGGCLRGPGRDLQRPGLSPLGTRRRSGARGSRWLAAPAARVLDPLGLSARGAGPGDRRTWPSPAWARARRWSWRRS